MLISVDGRRPATSRHWPDCREAVIASQRETLLMSVNRSRPGTSILTLCAHEMFRAFDLHSRPSGVPEMRLDAPRPSAPWSGSLTARCPPHGVSCSSRRTR